MYSVSGRVGFAGRDKRYFALNSQHLTAIFSIWIYPCLRPFDVPCSVVTQSPAWLFVTTKSHRVFAYLQWNFARLISNIIASTIKIEHCILSANSCIRQKPRVNRGTLRRRLCSLLVQNIEAILTQRNIRVKLFSIRLHLATGFYQNVEVYNLKRFLSLVQSTTHVGVIQYKFYNALIII